MSVYELSVSSAMVSSENQERDQLSDSTTLMVVLVIQSYNTCWLYVRLLDSDHHEPIILSESSSLDAQKRISLPVSDYQESGERLQREIMTAMGVPEHVQAHIISEVEFEFKRRLETSNSGSAILLKIDISRIHGHECDYNDPRIRQALLRLGISLPTPKPKYDISVLPRLVLLAGIDEEPENCSVCLEEFNDRDELIMLPCCHLFHYNCIDKWLDFSHSCPLCRRELL